MPWALLKYGLHRKHPIERHFPPRPELKRHYDVVIVGGGGHGLAAAYHLARDHGITDVAVLEKSWLGGGNTARNTTIIRANYLTPEGVAFYKESVELWRDLSIELDINLMYAERGHLTLAHTDAALRTARWRAEVNKHLGVASELVFPDEIHKICPQLNLSEQVRYPILGALYHPPGAIARHDAVAWGYARAAARLGVELHPQTVVTGSLHVYISQSARGELVMGGSTDPYPLYSTRSSLEFKEGLMAHMLELFPFLAEVKVLRQWAGMADMTPDFSPVMGLTPVENYYIDAGWGTWGFKATPVCGRRMAECIATGRQPALLEPFAPSRFERFALVGEKGAASVGH